MALLDFFTFSTTKLEGGNINAVVKGVYTHRLCSLDTILKTSLFLFEGFLFVADELLRKNWTFNSLKGLVVWLANV